MSTCLDILKKILFSNAWCCLVCYLHDKIKNICLLFIYTNAPETRQIQTDVKSALDLKTKKRLFMNSSIRYKYAGKYLEWRCEVIGQVM